MPSQLLSCLARNAQSAGEESRCDGVAAQTIEAQPVFGQIEPSQRPGASRAEPQMRRGWRASVRPGKRSVRFGVGKETKGGQGDNRQRKAYCNRPTPTPHRCGLGAINALVEVLRRRVATTFRSGSLIRLSALGFPNRLENPDGAGSFLMLCRCEDWLRTASDCRVRIERAGLG